MHQRQKQVEHAYEDQWPHLPKEVPSYPGENIPESALYYLLNLTDVRASNADLAYATGNYSVLKLEGSS